MNGESNHLEAIRVARPTLGLTHEPTRNINVDALRAQETLSVSGKPFATTGFTTAPHFGSTEPPSKPASRVVSPSPLLSGFGTRIASAVAAPMTHDD